MTNRAKVLIVGCGKIAGGYNFHADRPVLSHAAAYRALGAQMVACCDVDLEIARRFAQRWDIALCGNDLAHLLRDTKPEVVSICTPLSTRLSVFETILAAASVRAVLVEKPLAITRNEAEQILAQARAAQRSVLVNYFRAFDPFYCELEAQCRRGALGNLCEGTVRYYGTAMTNASHLLERMLAMFGEPDAVRGFSGDAESPLLELRFGTARVIFLPTVGCQYSPIEIDLLFQTQRVRIIDSERRVEWFQSKPDQVFDGYFNLVADARRGQAIASAESVLYAVEATLRAARARAASFELLERAVRVNTIIEKVGEEV
jgi:hypothetical protein